jgi:prolyl oligopeptidase
MRKSHIAIPLGLITVLLMTRCDKETTSATRYPATAKTDSVDHYFGEEVKDPYRWLEDDRSDETAEWVKAQNKVTFAYLDKIPYREIARRSANAWRNYMTTNA